MREIEFTPEAVDDLRALRKYDQAIIVETIEVQLQHQADQESKNRKRLRPNMLAEWELRIGAFRAFYDICDGEEKSSVKVKAIGEKVGQRLFIQGEEYHL
jgi:mRNA-degrading endonuclease RelE of RelBE toxin-antitoxin system